MAKPTKIRKSKLSLQLQNNFSFVGTRKWPVIIAKEWCTNLSNPFVACVPVVYMVVPITLSVFIFVYPISLVFFPTEFFTPLSEA